MRETRFNLWCIVCNPALLPYWSTDKWRHTVYLTWTCSALLYHNYTTYSIKYCIIYYTTNCSTLWLIYIINKTSIGTYLKKLAPEWPATKWKYFAYLYFSINIFANVYFAYVVRMKAGHNRHFNFILLVRAVHLRPKDNIYIFIYSIYLHIHIQRCSWWLWCWNWVNI